MYTCTVNRFCQSEGLLSSPRACRSLHCTGVALTTVLIQMPHDRTNKTRNAGLLELAATKTRRLSYWNALMSKEGAAVICCLHACWDSLQQRVHKNSARSGDRFPAPPPEQHLKDELQTLQSAGQADTEVKWFMLLHSCSYEQQS